MLVGQPPGRRLWKVQPHTFLKRVRACLGLHGIAGASKLTLRTFRSSRACGLVKRGRSLEAMLAAGEWCGAALLNYVKLKDINEGIFLSQTLDTSDAEASDAEVVA